ncbi:hypothetical protein BD410DRAFT_789225 [Rickenella mellea]|uniref:F-box domain-containing protein n=1 Tax=Rickenella mellea TaxID=50990 RepID=A0A4Y7Q4J4_9AGAM|nr:hypothetical protein BD410DRAFT_789225 [Rickenella mellea]
MYFHHPGNPRALPVEIIEEIFLHASPWELLQLQVTCCVFRNILENESIRRTARKSLVPPVPDPVIPEDIGGYERNWTEASYASFIFGQTKCTSCGETVPFELSSVSFSLRERACSFKKRCVQRQLDGRCEFPTVIGDMPIDLLLMRSFLPFAENGDTVLDFTPSNRLYNVEKSKKAIAQWRGEWNLLEALNDGTSWRSDTCYLDQRLRIAEIAARKSAWLRPFMETSKALVLWHEEYSEVVARSNVRKLNFNLAKDIAKSENVRFASMVRSDAMRRCLLAHSRSQTGLVRTAWDSIRSQVLLEIANEKAGIVQLPLPKGWSMKVVCPFCSKSSGRHAFMGGAALSDHIRDAHRDLRDVEVEKSVARPQTLLG